MRLNFRVSRVTEDQTHDVSISLMLENLSIVAEFTAIKQGKVDILEYSSK